MRNLITFFVFLLSYSGISQTSEVDSLSVALAFQNADNAKVDTSLKLIKKLYTLKDYNRAIKYIVESEKLCSELKHHKGIAEIAYYKALIYAAKNDYINAINGYETSKSLFISLNDTLGIAKVNNSIGLIEMKRGNYKKGLQHSLSAIEELEKKHLKKDLRDAYKHLAQAYQHIAAYDKAIEFNLKTLKTQNQLNDVLGANESYRYLAELYSIKKENRKAIEYYEKALQGLDAENDTIACIIYPKLGGEYLQFNDFENATKYLTKGYDISHEQKNKTGQLIALNNLGHLNLQQNRLHIAEKQLMEAGEIAKATNNNTELLKHFKLMRALDSTQKRFERAFVWQRHYYDLQKNLNKELASMAGLSTILLELDADLENDDLLLKNNLSNTTGHTLDSKTRFNRLQIIFYALLLALAVVSTFLILIYLKRNHSIKYLREVKEKNIEIELQNKAFLEQTQHLESVNNVKDKLFSIVSHDLKDSLSSINGFIDLLRDGSLSREEFDGLIPELSENANNASLLLFNLLNWSKSQMQSLEPKPSLFDIQEVFEEKIRLIEGRMENKGITLIDKSIRDFAYADRSMVEIIIQNLLANAAKFCSKGDTVTISNHINNGNCIISIADSGLGISKNNIDKLFKKDSSFTTIGTKDEKGTGLGLTICKELIDLNHGEIWVESTVNVGSTFYVQLPKSKPNKGDKS
ncbi:ATP-binding protein [Mariniflexile ostreae]|uniref:histidine kinase n=1 Tax=Mariniflexile ostreae TaxID=1520892 RepID=A0ABV5F8H9_9FLAO